MKIRFILLDGRVERSTDMEIPKDLTWEETKEFALSAIKKAYKYSNDQLPSGVTEGEL